MFLFPNSAVRLILLVAAAGYWLLFTSAMDKSHCLTSLNDQTNINYKLEALGGHQGSCVSVRLENQSAFPQSVVIAPGTRLHTEDENYQDLLIVDKQQLLLAPGADKTITVKANCCQSSLSSPAAKQIFTHASKADSALHALANYLFKHSPSQDFQQKAIWCISDGHPLSSIPFEPDADGDLRDSLAAFMGVTLPWYSISYREDSTRAFSGEATGLHGKISYELKHSTKVSAIVRAQNGQLMGYLLRDAHRHPGKHQLKLNLDIATWPKGQYNIHIVENESNVNKIHLFEI